jgi:hypothetical protein
VTPAAAAALIAAPASAQVGHDPARSPFRDITTRQGLSLIVGRYFGNETVAGVGSRAGLMTGVRFTTQLSGPADLSVSVTRIGSSRFVVDATRDTTAPGRVSGPIDMTLVAMDVALTLNLTGRKSWRRLAPYVGLGLGIAQPTETTEDPGGYRAGSNFTFVPTLGTRVFVSRRVALRAELRDMYLRYEWPQRYFTPFDSDGNSLPPVLPLTNPTKQWAHNFSLSAGLVYTFTF